MISSDEKIIFVSEVEAFGGAERSVLALARWLTHQAIPNRVVLYYDHVDLKNYADFALNTTVLQPPRNPVRKVSSLRRFVRSRQSGSTILASGIQSALHSSIANIGAFHTLMHDTPSLFSEAKTSNAVLQRLRRKLSDLVLRKGLKSGGTTIITSEYLQAEVSKLYDAPTAIARMGGMEGNFNFELRTPAGELRLLSVARVEQNKRIDWILRGLAILESGPAPLSARIDWHFDVVGNGSIIGELKDLAENLGIGARVKFHGFVSDDKLEDLYGSAHLFLMPARQGYGIPAIEALQRGIPILLHRESGVSDILLDTPWATVMNGGEQEFVAALDETLRRIIAGPLGPQPSLPTESLWAESVAQSCGWLK